MVVTNYLPKITWEKLPEDFDLPDEPVDNINQPLLAVALNDSLTTAGKLSQNAVTTTNYGICATVDDKVVVKAPDWCYIDEIRVPRAEIERSYTPQLQGKIPSIVMEFLSDTRETEYSTKPTYPPGKWYFYEQILKVPVYVLFDLKTSDIEVYHLNSSGRYEIQSPQENGKFWLPQINLFLGVWYGTRDNHTRNWLRWWDQQDQLLLWGAELLTQEKSRADQEKSRADQEKSRADQEKSRADQLAQKLRELGIEIE